MAKVFAVMLSFAVFLLIPACSDKVIVPDSGAPQSVPPDVESIIEPLEYSESASEAGDGGLASEAESEAAIVMEPETPEVTKASAKSEAPVSKSEESVPMPQSAPSGNPVSSPNEFPDVMKSVAQIGGLDSEKIEKELLKLINELRAKVGAEALGMEDDMLFAARIRSAEALADFSHTRPDGTPYNTAFDEAGFSYAGKWHGENLSSLRFSSGMFNEKTVALEMFNGLKSSPGHYQNMVGTHFLQTGVGVSISYGNEEVDIVSAQLFSSI